MSELVSSTKGLRTKILSNPLEVEALFAVQVLKQFLVLLAAEEIHIGNLEIAPVLAEAPGIAGPVAVGQQAHEPSEGRWHP